MSVQFTIPFDDYLEVDMFFWCQEHFGPHRKNWEAKPIDLMSMRIPMWFKYDRDAVVFKLTFCDNLR